MFEVISKTFQKQVNKLEKNALEEICAKLIINGYLQEDFHFTPFSIISYMLLTQKSRQLNNESKVMIELTLNDPNNESVFKRKKQLSSKFETDSKRFKIDKKSNLKNNIEIVEID